MQGDGAITLSQAVNLAILQDPSLTVTESDIAIAQARVRQASATPNPEFGIDLSNVLGSGAYQSLNAAETSVTLSQTIELGGKPTARLNAAERARDVLNTDLEIAKLDVTLATVREFLEVLALQTKLDIAVRRAAEVARLLPGIARRMTAGGASQSDIDRAEVSVQLARLSVAALDSQTIRAKSALAMRIGRDPVDLHVQGKLAPPVPAPPLSRLQEKLNGSPRLLRFATLGAQRQAELDDQAARAVPDLSIEGGARHFAVSDDTAMIIGVRIPIPIYDSNAGNIEAATKNVAKVNAELAVAERETRRKLLDAFGRLTVAIDSYQTLAVNVVPRARRAVDSLKSGYARGAFRAADILSAQDALSDAEDKQVEALAAYHAAASEIEALTGSPLHAEPDTAP
jgi:cobalt-zinc-cadmium efflux system outer membrane protein